MTSLGDIVGWWGIIGTGRLSFVEDVQMLLLKI